MSEWRTDDPPKDGSQFLADVGLPWPVVAAWNGCDEEFIYANLQSWKAERMSNDIYFGTEREAEIKRWMPMPELK